MTLRRPCTVCGAPNRGGNCPQHRWHRPKRRRTRHNPAYDDPAYKAERQQLRDQVELALQAGMIVTCAICHERIARMEDLSAEHVIPLREQAGQPVHRLAPAHRACNSSRRRATPPGRP